jgi:hypothetical protein
MSYLFLAIILAMIGVCAIIVGFYPSVTFGVFWAGVGDIHKGFDAFYAYQHLLVTPPRNYLTFIFHTIRVLHFAEYVVRAFNAVLAAAPAVGVA